MGEVFGGQEPGLEGGDGSGWEFAAGFAAWAGASSVLGASSLACFFLVGGMVVIGGDDGDGSYSSNADAGVYVHGCRLMVMGRSGEVCWTGSRGWIEGEGIAF